MAAQPGQRVVVLDRIQRDSCCDLAWENLFEGCHHGEHEKVRIVVACGQLFHALEYANENPTAETFALEVTDEIGWFFREVLNPFARYEREDVHEHELLQAWASDLVVEQSAEDADRAQRYEHNVASGYGVVTTIDAVLGMA